MSYRGSAFPSKLVAQKGPKKCINEASVAKPQNPRLKPQATEPLTVPNPETQSIGLANPESKPRHRGKRLCRLNGEDVQLCSCGVLSRGSSSLACCFCGRGAAAVVLVNHRKKLCSGSFCSKSLPTLLCSRAPLCAHVLRVANYVSHSLISLFKGASVGDFAGCFHGAFTVIYPGICVKLSTLRIRVKTMPGEVRGLYAGSRGLGTNHMCLQV